MEQNKNNLRKYFDNEPVYNEKYLKAKVKSYNEKRNKNFFGNKMSKEGSQLICLSVILIDSAFRTGENYHPKVFLECKYVVKKRSTLLMIKKFLLVLIQKILMKPILTKTMLMKKIVMKKYLKKIRLKKILVKKILVKKILMKKITVFSACINITKNYLTIKEIIIYHIKSNYLIFFKNYK